jgi:hypothetical protein
MTPTGAGVGRVATDARSAPSSITIGAMGRFRRSKGALVALTQNTRAVPTAAGVPELEALAEANLYGFASATMGDVLVGSCHRVAVRLPYASIPS